MNTNITDYGCSKIKEVMTSLDFPLLGEPRKIETGYEIIFSLEKKKRISKKAIKAQMISKNLSVLDIDVFIDKCGHYAYALVNPATDGVNDGRA